MIVRAATPEELPWLVNRVGIVPPLDLRGIVALDSSGRIRGMVGCCSWTHNSCEVHVSADTPIAWKHLAPAASEYLFRQLGLGVVVGRVRSSNKAARRANEHLGFRLAHTIKDGYAVGEDMLLYEMRREDCRYTTKEAA